MQLEEFLYTAKTIGLHVRPMMDAAADWDAVLDQSSYAPVSYTRSMICYQLCYVSHHIAPCVNTSVIVYHEKKPVAVLPLSIRKTENGWGLFSNEGHVLPPLFIAGLSGQTIKRLTQNLFGLMHQLGKKLGAANWCGTESYCGQTNMNTWHLLQMADGAQVSVSHEIYVDLSLSLAEIKGRMRKSYRSLVTSSQKLWTVDVFFRTQNKVFEEFRQLHRQVAGRVTRDLETWNEQEKAIEAGDAFLITLRNSSGDIVGGGLFQISPHEGMYAVGVYDRSLFDKPLGHLVQMRAIEKMKELGLRWYKVGMRHYLGDSPIPSDKELSIAHFKEGFATHIYLKLHTRNRICSETGRDIE